MTAQHNAEGTVNGDFQLLVRHPLNNRAKLRQLLFVTRCYLFDIAGLDTLHIGNCVEQVSIGQRVNLLLALDYLFTDCRNRLIGHLVRDKHTILVDIRRRDNRPRLAGQSHTYRHNLFRVHHQVNSFIAALDLQLKFTERRQCLHAGGISIDVTACYIPARCPERLFVKASLTQHGFRAVFIVPVDRPPRL